MGAVAASHSLGKGRRSRSGSRGEEQRPCIGSNPQQHSSGMGSSCISLAQLLPDMETKPCVEMWLTQLEASQEVSSSSLPKARSRHLHAAPGQHWHSTGDSSALSQSSSWTAISPSPKRKLFPMSNLHFLG